MCFDQKWYRCKTGTKIQMKWNEKKRKNAEKSIQKKKNKKQLYSHSEPVLVSSMHKQHTHVTELDSVC